jgi:hypothetical protein
MRGGGEVVDDEPARGGVVDDVRRTELRDEPRDVPRHPNVRRRRSISVEAARQAVMMHNRMTEHTVRARATD